ncbi:MAG: acyl-CoA dehydratase activase [Fidelibacterota bacterium]
MSQSIGICAGASTITVVVVEKNGQQPEVQQVFSRPHEGNPKQVITDLFQQLDVSKYKNIAVTGRKFKSFLNLPTISEPLAVERAYHYVNGRGSKYNAVISAGGETFMVYQLDSNGRISKVYTGNKCASGTGEFFLQQTRRMDVSLDEAIQFSQEEEPYHVSGRCSVFCKSDCTHATNIGIPKGRVVAGLNKMMAEKVLELLKNTPKKRIMMVGGTTRLPVMVDYLKRTIEHLEIPREAVYFEALGAALWALEHPTGAVQKPQEWFTQHTSQFDYHPPLQDFIDQVTFATMERGVPQAGDVCLLGLDVGSTTTKVVLMRERDEKILLSEYLRTNGDPVTASRKCYRSLLNQLQGLKIKIRGLGVTGSGRKIAGLHALTEGVINEIIAHAVAACHFDPNVDTLFEIGGQDAKYTYIINGVASDYAMNEACSAGTGSFLEESAKETLGIEMEDIADWALKGTHPPNFNDQCAAFISSDIKNSYHEGIPKEDIVAGLVYSICMNYVNRVKGARPVGKKVFMQGGVCYNRAVPIAMAALSGKEIIVPPEPGLMGAYGVALEVKHRLQQGLLEEQWFDLETLLERDVSYKSTFKCTGGKEKCDLACTINRIVIENKTYPFGGACNLYYNLRNKVKIKAGDHDLVVVRQKMVFEDYAPDRETLPPEAPTVGLSRSFLTNTYYPLFANFFVLLGYRPVLAEQVAPEGIDMVAAPFCYPCEIAHGYFYDLLQKNPDYLFLPHITGIRVEANQDYSRTCPLLQGEAYYLRSAFEEALSQLKGILTPVLDFSSDVDELRRQFLSLGRSLNRSRHQVQAAFEQAWQVQKELQENLYRLGSEALKELEADPTRIGVILFGRPYNAYAPEANKGIPHKFASRGITIIPVDCLDLAAYESKDHMYWSMGQLNLKGAHFIKDHPQLFGTYITNFSCGPDSFIVGYFRDILGSKPSLTLELDNHTADAGLETRIEAFLDIVARYRKLQGQKRLTPVAKDFRPAHSVLKDNQFLIYTSQGECVDLFDSRVRMVFASMGPFAAQGIAAAYRKQGIRTVVLPPMTEEELKLGRANTTCKECLPLQLTTGALIRYLEEERPEGEISVYFMPTANGPCRFGQYKDFLGDFVKKRQIEDVTFFSMTSEDGYGGLGTAFTLLSWKAVVIADIFEDIYNAMLVIARDVKKAQERLDQIWREVIDGLEQGQFYTALNKAVRDLAEIPYHLPLKEVPQVILVGEIYVRKEGISRRWLPEQLATSGIVTHVAPIHEWVYYIDWLVEKRILKKLRGLKSQMAHRLRHQIMRRAEYKIKTIMAQSGWYIPRYLDIDHVLETGENFLSRYLTGEAIVTIGGPAAEVGKEFCGAISVGPFGCMPNRLSESILNLNLDRDHVLRFRHDRMTDLVTREVPNLPVLTIESDGNPFPQLIEARLETFVLQALRMHRAMQKARETLGLA